MLYFIYAFIHNPLCRVPDRRLGNAIKINLKKIINYNTRNMVQKIRSRFSKIAIALVALALPAITFAQTKITTGELLGEIGGSKPLEKTGLGSKPLPETVAAIIRVFMGLLGTVAVVIILIGGFQWMTAGGNEEKVEKAKKLLGYGVTGLAIVLAAYSITTFVITSLVTATT